LIGDQKMVDGGRAASTNAGRAAVCD